MTLRRIVVLCGKAIYALVLSANVVLLLALLSAMLTPGAPKSDPEEARYARHLYWAGWVMAVYLIEYIALIGERLSAQLATIKDFLLASGMLFMFGVAEVFLFAMHQHPQWQFMLAAVAIPGMAIYFWANLRNRAASSRLVMAK